MSSYLNFGNQSEYECEFCWPSMERADSIQNKNRTISETSLVRLVSDIAPINIGHALIVPKKHWKSFLSINYAERHAIQKSFESWWSNYSITYPASLWAEHGTGNLESKGPCIEHAHIHLLPHNIQTFYDQVLFDQIGDFSEISMEDFWGLRTDDSYFVLGNGTKALVCVNPVMPYRQYVRSIIGRIEKMSNQAEWDWVLQANPENVRRTVESIKNASMLR